MRQLSGFHYQVVTLNRQWYGCQCVTCAGPGDTFTRIDHEKSVMGSALDQRLVQVEKLVLLPLEVGAGMWTLVVIRVELTVFVYHEDRPGFAFDLDLEALAARIFDIGCFTEGSFISYGCHDVC